MSKRGALHGDPFFFSARKCSRVHGAEHQQTETEECEDWSFHEDHLIVGEPFALRNEGPLNLLGASAKIKCLPTVAHAYARVLIFKGIQDIFRCIDLTTPLQKRLQIPLLRKGAAMTPCAVRDLLEPTNQRRRDT